VQLFSICFFAYSPDSGQCAEQPTLVIFLWLAAVLALLFCHLLFSPQHSVALALLEGQALSTLPPIGVSSFWMVVISSAGYAVGFFMVAKRIRLIAELRDCISLPDIAAVRYRSETVRLLMAMTIVLGVMGLFSYSDPCNGIGNASDTIWH